jgi:ribulose-5-phosphate 4-epimerase/fuculose-1-phosphate aldolase
VVIDDEAGQVAVEEDAGCSVAGWFKGVRAAIHKNHGLLTASRHSIDEAAFWFIALERVCQQALLVEASGITPTLGSPFIGWLHFQTIYDQLVAQHPDMFE